MTRTSRTMLNNSSNCGHPCLVALYWWCCSVAKLCLTLRSYGLQHASLPCPSLSPRVCSSSCPLCWGCHPTITSSVNHVSSCSVLNLSQHHGLFQWFSSSLQVAKELELQHQSFQFIFRADFLQDWLVWSTCCSRDSKQSSLVLQFEFESISSSVLSLIYGPSLTSVHDY